MPRPSPDPRLPPRHALLLGLLHGPAELLPISSSGHTELVPWLAGWPYSELDGELRKAFGVALHAGTAAALLIALRDEVGDAARGFDRRRAVLIALSFLPPAVVGLAGERAIEERLGTPESIAVGLILGSALMVAADRAGATNRRREDAGAVDALALGLGQAAALMPGLSRNGSSLAAARLRGFGRVDANALSRHVALPVIVGASVLKGVRLARRGVPREIATSFAVGTAASFASTLASAWIVRAVESGRSPVPYAAYRVGLAGVVLRKARRRTAARSVSIDGR
jgi:undecaprenyl-diphosphatase